MSINYSKHIWEGWTVQDFVNELKISFEFVKDTFKTKEQLKRWCMDNQPYYKKHIPDVVNHFNQELKLQ
jgi:hypothetical protein